jgi:hypothetical protein
MVVVYIDKTLDVLELELKSVDPTKSPHLSASRAMSSTVYYGPYKRSLTNLLSRYIKTIVDRSS